MGLQQLSGKLNVRRAAAELASRVMARIEALSRLTDEPGRITRTFASPAMRRANNLVAKWMRQAGMSTREDAIGNLIGRYDTPHPGPLPFGRGEGEPFSAAHATNAACYSAHPAVHGRTQRVAPRPAFILGSHLDTVRNAGKYDGPLGVLLAIACVEELRLRKVRLPFALEVVAFADEEGVRYQTAYLGSKVLAGAFDPRDLQLTGANGIALSEAIRTFGGKPRDLRRARLNPEHVLGYFEAHIEQGPVLEKRGVPVGIVEAIAGQSRLCLEFHGMVGHAGTVPMNARHDALTGAAEFVLAAEHCGVIATVGVVEVESGASNVIPGRVNLTLDVRDADDSRRKRAVRRLRTQGQTIAKRRGLKLVWTPVQETAAVYCDKALRRCLEQCVARQGLDVIKLPSGAGHDAAIMASITRAAMLFIRCAGGVSHHPDESVRLGDVRIALEVIIDFIGSLSRGDK